MRLAASTDWDCARARSATDRSRTILIADLGQGVQALSLRHALLRCVGFLVLTATACHDPTTEAALVIPPDAEDIAGVDAATAGDAGVVADAPDAGQAAP